MTCECTAGSVPAQRSEGGNGGVAGVSDKRAGVSDKRAAARTFGVAVRQTAWGCE